MSFNRISFIFFFYNSALHIAVDNNNLVIVKLLLQREDIKINTKNIYQKFFYEILCTFLYLVANQNFE